MDDTDRAGWRVVVFVCVVTWPKSIGQQQQLLAIVPGNWGEYSMVASIPKSPGAKLNRYEIW